MLRTTDFQPGMTVYGRDGVSLGQVQEVWARTGSHGSLPVSRYLLEDYGPIKGTRDFLATSDGYLQVQLGGRFSSEHHDLYFPLANMRLTGSPMSATVEFPAEMCRRYGSEWPEMLRLAS